MITVFHLNHDLDRKKRHGVIFPLLIGDDETPRAVAAKQLFEEGGYHEAAKVEGTDLNYAFRVTNNLENSWSLEPVAGVTPTAPGFEEFKGKQYGYKSSVVRMPQIVTERGPVLSEATSERATAHTNTIVHVDEVKPLDVEKLVAAYRAPLPLSDKG